MMRRGSTRCPSQHEADAQLDEPHAADAVHRLPPVDHRPGQKIRRPGRAVFIERLRFRLPVDGHAGAVQHGFRFPAQAGNENGHPPGGVHPGIQDAPLRLLRPALVDRFTRLIDEGVVSFQKRRIFFQLPPGETAERAVAAAGRGPARDDRHFVAPFRQLPGQLPSNEPGAAENRRLLHGTPPNAGRFRQ